MIKNKICKLSIITILLFSIFSLFSIFLSKTVKAEENITDYDKNYYLNPIKINLYENFDSDDLSFLLNDGYNNSKYCKLYLLDDSEYISKNSKKYFFELINNNLSIQLMDRIGEINKNDYKNFDSMIDEYEKLLKIEFYTKINNTTPADFEKNPHHQFIVFAKTKDEKIYIIEYQIKELKYIRYKIYDKNQNQNINNIFINEVLLRNLYSNYMISNAKLMLEYNQPDIQAEYKDAEYALANYFTNDTSQINNLIDKNLDIINYYSLFGYDYTSLSFCPRFTFFTGYLEEGIFPDFLQQVKDPNNNLYDVYFSNVYFDFITIDSNENIHIYNVYSDLYKNLVDSKKIDFLQNKDFKLFYDTLKNKKQILDLDISQLLLLIHPQNKTYYRQLKAGPFDINNIRYLEYLFKDSEGIQKENILSFIKKIDRIERNYNLIFNTIDKKRPPGGQGVIHKRKAFDSKINSYLFVGQENLKDNQNLRDGTRNYLLTQVEYQQVYDEEDDYNVIKNTKFLSKEYGYKFDSKKFNDNYDEEKQKKILDAFSPNELLILELMPTSNPPVATQENIELTVDYNTNLTKYFNFYLDKYFDPELQNIKNFKYELIDNAYVNNWNKPGIYNTKLKVTNTKNNTFIQIDLKINVIDNIAPNPLNKIFNIDVNKTKDLSEYLKELEFRDDISGLLKKDQINIIEDEYTKNRFNLGNYIVKIETIDCAGNKQLNTLTFNIQDKTAPILTTEIKEYTISYKDKLNLDDVLKTINVTDDRDTSDIKPFVEIDQYSSKSNIPGNYKIVFKAKDHYNNENTLTINVKVIDNVSPMIYTPIDYNVAPTQQIDLKYLLSNVYAIDFIDGELYNASFEIIDDNYSKNFNKIGQYYIKIKISDFSKNNRIITLTINVDEKYKLISKNGNYLVYFDYTDAKEISEIKQTLKDKKIINNKFDYSKYKTANEHIYNEQVTNKEFDANIYKFEYVPTEENLDNFNLYIYIDDSVTSNPDLIINKKLNNFKEKIAAFWNNSKKWIIPVIVIVAIIPVLGITLKLIFKNKKNKFRKFKK